MVCMSGTVLSTRVSAWKDRGDPCPCRDHMYWRDRRAVGRGLLNRDCTVYGSRTGVGGKQGREGAGRAGWDGGGGLQVH